MSAPSLKLYEFLLHALWLVMLRFWLSQKPPPLTKRRLFCPFKNVNEAKIER
jgi:hypothetical protein